MVFGGRGIHEQRGSQEGANAVLHYCGRPDGAAGVRRPAAQLVPRRPLFPGPFGLEGKRPLTR